MRVKKNVEKISLKQRQLISMRYKTVTKAVNREFWNSSSEITHSLYVGSYGRGTAIDTSDVDIMVVLPDFEYYRHNNLSGNSQSILLQSVRNALKVSYPRSEVRADGQIVKINFYDGIKFEILPAFEETNCLGKAIYIYPDSNMGGNWLSNNPKTEQDALKNKNSYSETNGLLFDTCKHMRFIRDNYFKSYKLSGIVIDTFVYYAIQGWHWTREDGQNSAGFKNYEDVLFDYFSSNCYYSNTLVAPGSEDCVSIKDSKECLLKVLNKMKS